jgi:hypothetical protein
MVGSEAGNINRDCAICTVVRNAVPFGPRRLVGISAVFWAWRLIPVLTTGITQTLNRGFLSEYGERWCGRHALGYFRFRAGLVSWNEDAGLTLYPVFGKQFD